MNIKKNITLALILFSGLIYSCSGDDNIDIDPNGGSENADKVYLSMAFNSCDELRAGGNYDNAAESKIYSLEVLVFRSDDGTRNGYGAVAREKITSTNKNYDQEYKEKYRVEGIEMTAGKRDIYVVANAPSNSFKDVKKLSQFLEKFEKLKLQGYGLRAHPEGTIVKDSEGNPIGGIESDGLHTNLTMCHFIKGVEFNKGKAKHYLGYPTSEIPSGGENLGSTFEVERLVARVALGKVKFDMDATLTINSETTNNYTCSLDSVFLINAKTASPFSTDGNKITDMFGYGCAKNTYTKYLLPSASGVKCSPEAQNNNTDLCDVSDLFEAVYYPDYDITTTNSNQTPIWFYTFENEDKDNPTYLMIGVRINYETTGGNLKTAKFYYPVIVNEPGRISGIGHTYIKRNYQYRINATIKKLGKAKMGDVGELKSLLSEDLDGAIEIDETVGRNLFPWTGNKYQ